MTPSWTRDGLTSMRRRSGLDPRTALFVLGLITQAEIGDIVGRYIPPPSIRQQYTHASYAACRTCCTSRHWSTTPPTRSVCGGSATGSHRRPRINAHCLPWPAWVSRDHCVRRDRPSGTNTRWCASQVPWLSPRTKLERRRSSPGAGLPGS